MNVEEMAPEEAGLGARAARYAALADPVRLRIVDLLALGDRAPTELQEELGISSSLLAHHLNVLEDTGLAVRTRSEGDRRRSYVRLRPNALDGLAPARPVASAGRGAAQRVVFVCTANSARSQLAAALWERASALPVASAGTHPADAIEAGALAAAGRHGIALDARTPRALTEVLDTDDWIVTVCDSAHEELGGLVALHWSVPDPVRVGTDAAFDAAVEELARRVDDLAPRMSAA